MRNPLANPKPKRVKPVKVVLGTCEALKKAADGFQAFLRTNSAWTKTRTGTKLSPKGKFVKRQLNATLGRLRQYQKGA